MTKSDLAKLEKIAIQLYRKGETFSKIAIILELTTSDIICLILADNVSKKQRFKNIKSTCLK
jgi:hypothetical protein